jgi:hypothetical protein
VAIRRRARALVSEVCSTIGWDGPPFNLNDLASYRGFKVRQALTGFTDLQDACVTPGLIALNAKKPPRRRRYSVAHEIVHTLFPDYEDQLRQSGQLWRQEDDDNELERLCQIGAAELLMPAFEFAPMLESAGLTLTTVLKLHETFDASVEATVRHAVDLWHGRALAVFFRTQEYRSPQVRSRNHISGYSPYAPLVATVIHGRSDDDTILVPRGLTPPKKSVVMKAWKRAWASDLAFDTYFAEEIWSSMGAVPIACESMVLPRRAPAPFEVLCLLRLSD